MSMTERCRGPLRAACSKLLSLYAIPRRRSARANEVGLVPGLKRVTVADRRHGGSYRPGKLEHVSFEGAHYSGVSFEGARFNSFHAAGSSFVDCSFRRVTF